MNLPNDPFILLSFVNTKLRDEFCDLNSFCEYYNVNVDDIAKKLNNINFFYNLDENQFK